MPQLLKRTLECPLRLGLQRVVGSDRASRASLGALTAVLGAVRGGCEGAVRRREQKKSSTYVEHLETVTPSLSDPDPDPDPDLDADRNILKL